MNNKIILPLKNNNRYFYINENMLKEKEEELEEFILKSGKMDTLSFVKKVLLFNEVQSNNSVEGYYDDIEKIKKIVNEKKIYKNSQEKDKLRIINLYEGYRYILDNKDITKETLKELNSILSKGLLDDEDYKNMGEYYRKNPVYIYYSSDVTKRPDMGLDASLIEDKMDELLDFMNNYSFDDTKTMSYLKSQILHFYFVYIHPYYDVNGRTARTTSMWYLLNNNVYPYVIFNRGIQINKNEYYKIIRETKKYSNISLFLKYMMNTVLAELEKEYFMQLIANSCSKKLETLDYQTLHYLLSIKGNITVSDFANMYNRYNNKKKVLKIEEEMILPLIEKGILIKTRETNGHLSSFKNNYELAFNFKYVDYDDNLIKNVHVKKSL
mgnify:FL=1